MKRIDKVQKETKEEGRGGRGGGRNRCHIVDTGIHVLGAASQWEGAKTQRQQSISIGKASTTWRHCPAQMPGLQCGLKAKGMGQSFLELFWSQVTTQFPALFLFVCLFVSES